MLEEGRLELERHGGLPCSVVSTTHNYTYRMGEHYYKIAPGADVSLLQKEHATLIALITATALPLRLDPQLVALPSGRLALRLANLKDIAHDLSPEEEARSLGAQLLRVQALPIHDLDLPLAHPEEHLRSRLKRFPQPQRRATADLMAFLDSILPTDSYGGPRVLTHGDLNRGNYVQGREGCVFIDWEFAKAAPRAWDPAVIMLNAYNTGFDPRFVPAFIDTYGHIDEEEFAWAFPQIVALSASWAHFKNLTDPTYTQTPASRIRLWEWYRQDPQRLLHGHLPAQ